MIESRLCNHSFNDRGFKFRKGKVYPFDTEDQAIIICKTDENTVTEKRILDRNLKYLSKE
jgi:hypothetical protein